MTKSEINAFLDEIEPKLRRRANVLCVTMSESGDNGRTLFHRNITGYVEVKTSFREEYGMFHTTGTTATINPKVGTPPQYIRGSRWGKIRRFRPGLNGEVVAIEVEMEPAENDPNPTFTFWTIYTDIPTGSASPERLQKEAEGAIRHGRYLESTN